MCLSYIPKTGLALFLTTFIAVIPQYPHGPR
jgi:hypothetical protein